MTRREISPALAGSLLLHGTVAAALLISWPWARKLEVGSVVPVTIVANAPAADPRPAVEAAIPQEAMTEAPVLDAPPEVTPPEPQPTPTPAAPTPPTPAPKAAQKPAPKTPAAKPEKQLDLAALEASVSKLIRPSKTKASSAPKGPTHQETATTVRETQGTSSAMSALAMSGFINELQRNWNPNCAVEGGRDVLVRVVFRLGPDGRVAGQPTSQLLRGPSNSVGQAAAERAVRAVYASTPSRNVPPTSYGEQFKINFDAREACST